MDMEYLLVLQQFREGMGQAFRDFFMQMSFLTDKETSIVIVAIIYWCVSKRYGDWLWLGWGMNRLVNGFLKVTACVYRPWIKDPRILPDPMAKAGATGYSFPSGHSTNGASIFGSGVLYPKFRKGLRILLGVMVVLVALSRNFLGVHTPQDVIVGMSLGLLGMYLTTKLMAYLDAHPEKEIAAASIVIGVAVLVVIYANVKSYPVDYDPDGNILVEGAKMAKDTYKSVGWILAIWIGRLLDRRYVHFTTDVKLSDKIFRLAAGLLSFYALSMIICPVIKNAVGGPAGTLIDSFIQVFYIVFVFPLICMKVENRTVSKTLSTPQRSDN